MRLGEYPMVLWAKSARDPVRLILETHNYLLEHFGEEFAPNSYAGNRIELNISYLESFIREYTAADGVFYTRFDAPADLRFSLSLNQPSLLRLPEVLTVSFTRTSVLGGDPRLSLERLLGLFMFEIRLFKPIWGSFYDEEKSVTDELRTLRLRVDRQKVPLTIGWFNYFGSEMVDYMGGAEKVLAAPAFLVERVPETGGLLMVLQPVPFDFTFEEHRLRQQKVQKFLELDRLHKAFPK